MLRRIIFTLFICSTSLASIAQLVDDIQTPKIIPPSPDAQALGKYGEIPVDKSTGVPAISIPLYEIKTPRFTLPISLSYHASGIKVEEIPSWVGSGWALNAGGLITRTIMGLPDDGGLGYLTNHGSIIHADSIQWPRDIQYLSQVLTRQLDVQPDNFFYNFGSHSGAFVFGDDTKPVLIPYQPIRINFDQPSGTFQVSDEEGNQYSFTTKEHVTSSIPDMSGISSWYLTQMVSADLSDTIKFTYSTDTTVTTEVSFNFSQMVSNCGPGTCGIVGLQPMVTTSSSRQYNAVRISSILFKGGKVDFIAKGGRLDPGGASLDSVIVSNLNFHTGQFSRLKSYKLLTDYTYSTLSSPSTITLTEPYKYRLILTGLSENDANNDSVKTHHFDYNSAQLPPLFSYAQDNWGYFNGKVGNLNLLQSQPVVTAQQGVTAIGSGQGADRSVSPTDMQAGILQKITYPTKGYTVFNYECNKQEGIALDSTQTIASGIGLHQEVDTVNYFPTNNMINAGGSIFHIKLRRGNDNPTQPLPYVELIRVSDSSVIYSLTSNAANNIDTMVSVPLPLITVGLPPIQYLLKAVAVGGDGPTSSLLPYAIISTTYEAPTGADLIDMGGLRISSINNYNADGTLIGSETYKYGNHNQSGGGILLSYSLVNHFVRASACDVQQFSDSDPGGTVCVTLGNTDFYTNNSYYPMAFLNGSPIGYPTVTVYNGDSVRNTGKSLYTYTIFPDSLLFFFTASLDGMTVIPVAWKNGDPIEEDHYLNKGSNQYTLLSSKATSYSLIGKRQATGTTIDYNPVIIGNADRCSYFIGPYVDSGTHLVYTCVITPWSPDWLYWYDYPLSTGVRVPVESCVTLYDSSGSHALSDTTHFFYDDTTLYLPTRTVKKDSKGHTITTYIRRPLDKTAIDSLTVLSDTASMAIDSMVARNIISPVIQQVEYRDSIFTELSLTNYKNWDSNVIAPRTVQIKVRNNPLDTRLQFNRYDANGNLLEVQKTNDVTETYLWGYNGLYPVARILNSSYDVAKTNITQAVLDAPTNDTTLRSQLNNLRTIPHAQVMSYTYLPLVGLTSQTDVAGRTTYYEYDAFQRLQRIRDQDHNILKTLDYQYQFTNSCGSNCFIEPMQTLAGTNTLGYPVGVFNVHGNLLGNASNQSGYITLWNTDTADSHTGTLAAGADSLHFHITLNTGKTLPAITGCRYYQVDLHWSKFDGVRNLNGAYVDFGDGTGMHLGKTLSDTPAVIASNTTYGTVFGQDRGVYETYFVHTYPDTSKKTITLYHNDANESEDFDNLGSAPTGLKTLTNLRGNLPQNTDYIGGSSYQQPGMTSIDSIHNWSSIHNIHGFRLNDGDGVDPCMHIHYPQDFLAGNQQLDTIFTAPSYYTNGVRDTSFKISRLKSDWNTYFTHLRYLDISDRDWNREDLSALKELTVVQVTASTLDDLDDTGSPLVTISSTEIDAILNQVAAGAGQTVHNGFIFIDADGPLRTSTSDASVRLLKEKGWQIQVNRVTQ